MKKLLIVTDTWAPKIDGVVRSIEFRMPELERIGFAVTVAHPGQFRTVPFPLYPELRLALFPKRRLRLMLAGLEPDYIHIETEGALGLAARSLCRRRGLKFTSSYHTHFQLYADVYARLPVRFLLAPAAAALRWFHSGAVRTFVSTESLREELARQGFKNLAVCPLGVDTGLFERQGRAPSGSLERPVFAFFSRLAPEKSPEEFLRLDLPGTKLVIGDGPDRRRLEKKYPAAKFVGFQRGQALVDWLSGVDVVVMPSRTETFGLVVIEALAMGIPVAAHDVMGPRDIIKSGVHGYLSDDLKQAALDSLSLSREACRARALEFSWKASAETYAKSLEPAGERGAGK
jgi:glycosyltransferase involved in cell wall biosynthesis